MNPSEISSGRRRPLHVLTITPFYPKVGNEGSGCFVAEPLAELTKLGIQSTVFAAEPFYRAKSEKLLSMPEAEWVQYAALPGGVGLASSGAGLFMRLRSAVERVHARSAIDVIHAHGALPCGHAALRLSRLLNVPFVVTVHGLDAFSARQVSGWAGDRCVQMSRRVYAAARRVIGVSRHVCDVVMKEMPELSASTVVYNGVDPSLFAPGGDPTSPVLLTVGNLISTKGHELIVHALAALLPEFPGLRWVVIGEGPEWTRIRALADKLGVLSSIRFRGRQDRTAVAEACQNCTVFVLPSRYEGLGCVYLEAMACGKAAVGCEGQGIEEVIRHEENGWLVPPNGREELIAGLRALLGDDARRAMIGAAARETILGSYTLAHQAQRLETIFQESLG